MSPKVSALAMQALAQAGNLTVLRAFKYSDVDKETGVAPWFEPFEAKYEFTYAGTGKKGGY